MIRLSGQSAADFRRHVNGDWGEHLDGHDTKQNQIAFREGGRLMSAFQTRKGEDVWVITECDWSYTTLLTPSNPKRMACNTL